MITRGTHALVPTTLYYTLRSKPYTLRLSPSCFYQHGMDVIRRRTGGFGGDGIGMHHGHGSQSCSIRKPIALVTRRACVSSCAAMKLDTLELDAPGVHTSRATVTHVAGLREARTSTHKPCEDSDGLW